MAHDKYHQFLMCLSAVELPFLKAFWMPQLQGADQLIKSKEINIINRIAQIGSDLIFPLSTQLESAKCLRLWKKVVRQLVPDYSNTPRLFQAKRRTSKQHIRVEDKCLIVCCGRLGPNRKGETSGFQIRRFTINKYWR